MWHLYTHFHSNVFGVCVFLKGERSMVNGNGQSKCKDLYTNGFWIVVYRVSARNHGVVLHDGVVLQIFGRFNHWPLHLYENKLNMCLFSQKTEEGKHFYLILPWTIGWHAIQSKFMKHGLDKRINNKWMFIFNFQCMLKEPELTK